MSTELQFVLAAWFLYVSAAWLRASWFMICPPNPPGRIKYKWFIAEYDFWIGSYLDRTKKIAYWFPLPMFGVKFERKLP